MKVTEMLSYGKKQVVYLNDKSRSTVPMQLQCATEVNERTLASAKPLAHLSEV